MNQVYIFSQLKLLATQFFRFLSLSELCFSVNERRIIKAAAQAEHSSGRLHDTPVIVANGRTIRVSAAGITDLGEAYANSSSLNLRWELSSCEGLAYWDYALDIVKSNSWEIFLALQNESGLVLEDSY